MATTTQFGTSLFVWKPEYSVGIQEIDQQHKKLVSLVGELHKAMSEGHGADAVDVILQDLLRYTKVHFQTEERLMERYGYPGLAEHKHEHAKLTAQVVDFYNRAKGNRSITLQLMTFLKEWLVNHIQHSDKEYQPFLNGKGVR